MPTLTLAAQISYGDGSPDIQMRRNLSLSYTYTEAYETIAQVAASQTDFPITFGTVTAPKFILVEGLDVGTTIKLGDGTLTVPSALHAGQGWIMFANPDGQAVNRVLVTTPPAPTTGARVRVTAFE